MFDSSQKPLSIESVLTELTRSGSDVSVIVNTPNWNAIPVRIQEWDGKDEGTMMRLLDEMLRILTLASDSEVPVTNKRLLHSSLSALSQNPIFPKKGRLRITHCLATLDSLPDGPFVLVETEELRRMEQSQSELEQLSSETTKHEKELETRIHDLQQELEEEKKKAEADRMKMEEVKTAQQSKLDGLTMQLAGLPIWVGTESLQTLDRAVHRLTPTTLTQINNLEDDFRTAFTFPIDEGEWELKIRASENPFWAVSLGFLRHPLPDDAAEFSCGIYKDGIGGDFGLDEGGMWKNSKEFQPEVSNKECDRIGQTAAIRVNMRTREARLFVDDEEQPGIFTNIPSHLCLAITTGFTLENQSVEVLWLKRLRGSDELEQSAFEERRTQKLESKKLKQQLVGLPIWIGTESLQTLDRSIHTRTPTALTQIIKLEDDSEWRTAFTFPIDEGEWELKIRATENDFVNVRLGFLRHPLPEVAALHQCGAWKNGIGGDFFLDDGRMWKGIEFKPEGTNKKCDRIGQTAAIRLNMRTKKARLFVDDEEQPGIFFNIPSPLCLAITTGFIDENLSEHISKM
ncbi:hypothetical protein BLNAU_22738 [Blattamonas nauphoetae]|uniref:Uncharacterized protein n=1 Tax=Blattamonas nauphoetae TaxID=2049346 RepID=A0ABQ9WS77_9EUKA|nr:hypothetical protein BLNAU_22738 [Blattamonas nauphoetae]